MGNVFSIQCGDALMGRCWDCIAKKSVYIYKLEENLDALEAARDHLIALRNDVIRTAINQQRPQMEQPDKVVNWLSTVDHTVAQVTELLDGGAREKHNLCMAGFCSKNCKSTYKFGKSVAQSLDRVNALMAEEAGFKQVVVDAPAKQLESDLRELSNAKEELKALKEDLQQRISLEGGPEKPTLKQVQLWLSKAQDRLAKADKLLDAGPRELNKLLVGDISNSIFVGMVAQQIEDVCSLRSEGNFREVVTAKAVPRRVVERIQNPTVGTEEMLQQAWALLHGVEVGIIGIYGMGGVGKTTLLTHINNKFARDPNGFDIVIWIVVSKDLKLEKIQESIWKQIRSVDDRWLHKSFQEKAQDIFDGLQGKKFVLLLDDVWKQFDLTEIGVPLPTQKNGSKVVLTTRSFTVCKQMEATQTMKVKPLKPEEAWQLFEEKVGKIDEEMLHVAQKVAEECCGLPIALITIGRAMASRSALEEWQHALKVLRRSVSNLHGMEDELYQDMEVCVFKRLKFSYDSLANNAQKRCFLYCALFPEDCKIVKHDLVRYWVAEKFCGRHEGYGIVYTLIRQCLLEDEGESVKLHDVVRDMAVWIACECEKEKHKFFVKAGAQLSRLPGDEEWQGAEKVSFMDNSFTSLEGTPKCSDLLTLFLHRNNILSTISEGFFKFMTRLTVLDLSHTEIQVFPLEISNLESLEFLNLSHTNLESLPIELKSLTRLKYLILHCTNYLKMIPVEVIYNLSKLQVLNMFRLGDISYGGMANNVLSVDGNILFKELMRLKNLSEVSLTVTSVSFLHLICSNQILLSCLHWFSLYNINDTKSLDISSLANAKQLHLLLISQNPDLEEMVIEERERQAPRSSLNNNLLIFSGLREVYVSYNNNMRHLTWLVFAPHLTFLKLSENGKMEEIISAEKLSEHHARGESFNLFAKLQVLYLRGLPELKTIYPVALSFPCLKKIRVEGCPALKKLPLKSESAEGCNVVIRGEESWWNELTWEDHQTKAAFSSCFQNEGFF